MNAEPTPHEKRLGQAVAILGMRPTDYERLTFAEWLAICDAWNQSHK
ncbi:hypothetical protein [Microbacterium sp. SGAir0570]|nr:hypothetical protein [Microbacterium sp. SGAir0570]